MDHNLETRSDNMYFLEPGYVYFSQTPSKVHSVLGSCVSVCLWDKRLQHGGMNHYVKPAAKVSHEATPTYGNASMIALLNLMKEAGSRSRDLVAQIFGGGFKPGNEENSLGAQNVNVARRILNKNGIKIVSEDVGGTLGRKVVFDTFSGRAAVIKVENIRETDWY